MNPKTAMKDSAQEPDSVTLQELEVRVATPDEIGMARELLGDEHYLGIGRDVGRTLVQVVHHQERWVAILVWGPAAMKLIDREEWIGWTDLQRAERLGLVVQNSQPLGARYRSSKKTPHAPKTSI